MRRRFEGDRSWLRAGVLGANDGIISIASAVVGAAATSIGHSALVLLGVLMTVGGAVSMGLGEFVSVSVQRDQERRDGVSRGELARPWQAAAASLLAFSCGAVLPVVSAGLAPFGLRVLVVMGAVLAALVLTGVVSARLSGQDWLRPTARIVLGGALGMGFTWSIGHVATVLLGHTVS